MFTTFPDALQSATSHPQPIHLPDNIILGSSSAIQKLYETVLHIAPKQYSVHVSGPTGAGKEWVANLLHSAGQHPTAEFFDVNCSTISADLIESILFGHEKGAFTGAVHAQEGYFSLVKDGTLFLDEIGELPLSLQPKLLRVLETGQFRPLGSSQSKAFHGRIVTASHRNLEKMVADGTFRQDLFHRINVITLNVPSLAERREDIPALVAHFAKEQNKVFSDDAVRLLKNRDWPGNIRELRNTVFKLSAFSNHDVIDASFVQQSTDTAPSSHEEKVRVIAKELLSLGSENIMSLVEHVLATEAFAENNSNKQAAAKVLGIHRKSLERRLKAFNDQSATVVDLLSEADQFILANQYKKAIHTLSEAKEAVLKMPPTDEVQQLNYSISIKLAANTSKIEGWSSSKTHEALNEAAKLICEKSEPTHHAHLLLGKWWVALSTSDLVHAAQLAQALYLLGTKSNNDDIIALGLMATARTAFLRGDVEKTSGAIEEYFYFRGYQSKYSPIIDFDPYPYCLEVKCLLEISLGTLKQASLTKSALNGFTNRTSSDFAKSAGLHALIWTSHLLADKSGLTSAISSLKALSEQHGFSDYFSVARLFEAEQRYLLDNNQISFNTAMEHFAAEFQPANALRLSAYLCLLAGNTEIPEKASPLMLATIDHALNLIESNGETLFTPLALELNARALSHQGLDDEANKQLDRAWRLAKSNNFRLMLVKIGTQYLQQHQAISESKLAEFEVLKRHFHDDSEHPRVNAFLNALNHHTEVIA
ncbi:hypothetical protein CS022_11900 [Veronia nyctiphanis]|uniref:Sigma-54 factor interaction domain-containing protein n=1 Tax=Veronia nyctiphanis TaxID=1278244 RepID=A0A4Q0YVK0_9GAMM|nr:sigma-54 dependent transcriptional regulator [Veronia nyctiphanis]RXJ73001.1 hypothetical protein CS022_11900 [Veronia nyctiphanis]